MPGRESEIIRINVGCGASPTEGWVNYDNSWMVRLARLPLVGRVLSRVPVLGEDRKRFAATVIGQDIRVADAVRLPHPADSVSVVYASHMLEHLDREEAMHFLAEARRVLEPGGTVRIAVPDLALLAEDYLTHGDADQFVANTHLSRTRPRGVLGKVYWLLVGDRHHAWMYDGRSLAKLLVSAGFRSPQVVPAGTTTIPSPGQLDLHERADETVYVEARAE